MIDFLIENLFSMIADMSVEKIKELRTQYSNQRILYMTAKQFFTADEFKREFRHVTTVLNEDAILAIPSDKLEVSRSIDELKDSIAPIFDSIVLTEDEPLKQRIIGIIAAQYRAKRNLSISLFDVIEEQRKDTEAIIDKISSVDKKALFIADSIEKREALKIAAFQNGINRKVERLVLFAAQSFIMIVTKKPAQISGSDMDICTSYVNGVRKQMEDGFPDIDATFIHIPIQGIAPNPNGSIKPVTKEYAVLQFLWTFRLQLNSYIDDLLKYYDLLPDAFVISMISLGKLVEEDLNSHAIEQGVAAMLMNAKLVNPEQYVKGLKEYYRKLGEEISSMAEFVSS